MIVAAANAYQQTQVATANQVQLIVMLYDSAIQSMELAGKPFSRTITKDKARFLDRGMAIVGGYPASWISSVAGDRRVPAPSVRLYGSAVHPSQPSAQWKTSRRTDSLSDNSTGRLAGRGKTRSGGPCRQLVPPIPAYLPRLSLHRTAYHQALDAARAATGIRLTPAIVSVG